MTSDELAVVGVPPTGENIHDSENVQSRTDEPTAETIRDSGEDGEIRSENRSGSEEDLSNVDADVSEHVFMKAKSYPPAFVFGESKVMADLIKEYEETRFFPTRDGRPPSGEQVPTPEANEVVIFRDFLENISLKMHQLTLNSFLELSKFFWIMKTFKCTFGADIFAHLFELVIEKDILKLDDGRYYEAHYVCCTFNT
jgi:hypothetical protein